MVDKQKYIQQLLDHGLQCHRAGDLDTAQTKYRQILELQQDHIHALNNLGAALQEQGKYEEAIFQYNKVILLNSEYSYGYYNLGNAYRANNQIEDAMAAYEKAIALNPDYADAYNNLGLCLQDLRRLEEAVAVYHKAKTLRPDYAEAYNNLGNALQQKGQMNESIRYLNKALSLKNNYADAHNNMGVVLFKQGKLREAIIEYEQAINIRQDFPDAHCNLGHALLLRGDLKKGFSEYEWRWRVKGVNYEKPRSFKQPLWDGSDLKGKTILLHAEQGYGDTIHFIRYASLIADKGACVIIECQPLLQRLLAKLPGIHQTISRGASLPKFDVHAPILSLPHICGTTLDTIPAAVPYIAAPPSGNTIINASPVERIRIGIAWAGSPTHANDTNRSCAVEHFNLLMDVPGFNWYSLQKEGAEGRKKNTGKYSSLLKDLGPSLNDFADTAAVIDQLDLIITVDTAVAHLAGAMAKAVWVLLPFVSDWRWMMERTDSPWYPTMRLFRQIQPNDWDGVFEKVRNELFNINKKERIKITHKVSENGHEAAEKSECRPEFQDLLQEAKAHLAAGRLQDAESSCRKLLVHKQFMAEASYILSTILKQKHQHEEAIELLCRAAKLDASSVQYPFELGNLLQDAGRFEEALASYERALKLRPDLAPIHNNKGNILKLLGRFEEAAACYAQAAKLNPDSPEIQTNRGVALADQRLLEEAEHCYRKALALKADHASAHWNLSLLMLLKGNYEEGWPEYEWRWRVANYSPFLVQHKKPRWQGEKLAGRTLLLHCEQGLGDTLQFVRYAPLVAERGGRVIVQCQPELVRLLSHSGKFGEIVGLNKPFPDHDIQCSLMSLPFVFETTLSSIPADIPYLFPEKELVSKWGKRMGMRQGLKVGLVWAGKLWENIPAAKSIDLRRSVNLNLMAKFGSIPGLTFYSLQMGEAAGQIKTASDLALIDLTEEIKDFSDTAAMIDHLDLVITVDTSVAHLAGAMGKKVWILSRFDGCWRWLLDREDSPWYPSVRLFRQTSRGSWDDVIERVAGELRRLLETY